MAPTSASLASRLAAELFGTFLLVFSGVGTAVFAANFPSAESNSLGVDFLGVALAFGLTVLVGIYTVGQVWVFILAPLLGALIAGASYKVLFEGKSKQIS